MRWISTIVILLACTACQTQPDANQVAALPDQSHAQAQPVCHDFTTSVTAGSRAEQASGRACEQPDGSWSVVQNTPGLPPQGYVLESPGQPEVAAESTPAQTRPSQSACSSYTAPVTVSEQPRQAVIEACPQPDGSWKITQNTPGLPAQVYQVPPPSSYPYSYPYPVDYVYPDFLPYWVGAPWYFGLAPSIVVVQKFHHFNHGFGRGFGHGFTRGFGPGFSRGFAAGHGGGGGRH